MTYRAHAWATQHEPHSMGHNCASQPRPSFTSALGNHNPPGGSWDALSHATAPLSSRAEVGRALGERHYSYELCLQVCARVPSMAVVPEENHPSNKGYGTNCSEEREVAPGRPEGTRVQKGVFPLWVWGCLMIYMGPLPGGLSCAHRPSVVKTDSLPRCSAWRKTSQKSRVLHLQTCFVLPT